MNIAAPEPCVAAASMSWRFAPPPLSTSLSPPADVQPQASADKLRTEIQNAIDGKGILP